MLGNYVIMSYRTLVTSMLKEEKTYEECTRSFHEINQDLNKDLDEEENDQKMAKVLLLSPVDDQGL